jgi:hypothetical protein
VVPFTDKEASMTTTTRRLLALGATCAALAPAAAIATAQTPAGVPTSAQCEALKVRLVQDSNGVKRPLDASTTAQLAACDHAYGGDKGGPLSGAGGPRPSKPTGPASGSKVA